MHRELNPQLFTPVENRETIELDTDFRVPSAPTSPYASEREMAETRAMIRHLDSLLKEASQQVRECMSQVRDARLQLDEAQKVQNARLDRLTQVVNRMEQTQARSIQDLNEKYAGVQGRVNERRVTDGKIEELIERHNHIVQGFEMRLKQMQKVISEREMQMVRTMSLLEDARAEIIRMKKL